MMYWQQVLLVGDYVVRHKEGIEGLVGPLQRLRAPAVAVLGNHDCYEDRGYVRARLEAAGVTVLENATTYPLGAGLAVVGLGDLTSGQFRPEEALPAVPPEEPRVVLSHNPDTFERLAAYRCDLVLSGHLHGGQFMLPWDRTPLLRLYWLVVSRLPTGLASHVRVRPPKKEKERRRRRTERRRKK